MPSVPRRPGRPTAEHQAAVARRLDLLRAELAATPVPDLVPDPAPDPTPDPWPTDDDRSGDDAWWTSSTRIPGVADLPRVPPPVPDVRPEADPVPEPPPGRVPSPGRHASRRRHDLVAALVPETLRGRVMIGPAQLTVVAVLVCVGLVVLAWTTVRSRPEAVPDLASSATAPVVGGATGAPVVALPPSADAEEVIPPAAPSAAAAAGETSAAGTITVDVAGKVRRPGIAVLDTGSRVVDAIEAAGGVRQGVDLTPLNLARPLVDGEQIVVGIDPPAGVAASALAASGAAPAAASGAPGMLVDLNTATDAELDTLPDVGPVTAQSIISWREEHGGFTTVDELLEVDGIGEATLTRLAPHVTV